MHAPHRSSSSTLRTFALLAALTGLLVGIGVLIGGSAGLVVFAGFALAANAAMWFFSAPLALRMARARPLGAHEHRALWDMNRRLAQRASVPEPRLYITPNPQPNAFATGRGPSSGAIAVTQGLIGTMSEREMEGVIAHEMAHIANRDVLVASIAAAIAGCISALVNLMQLSLWFGDDSDNPLGIIGTLATIILAPIGALVIQMAISRKREYLADESAARYMNDPHPLADALESLHRAARPDRPQADALAALYIANPLGGGGARGVMRGAFSTHPPVHRRVERLRRMI